ncbi:MAG: cation transporter [Acidobacteria bacterium]|nr:cation transporter [Acidobacteriota bacterium]
MAWRRPSGSASRGEWLSYARFLALFTVLYNLAEGLVSMGFGWTDDSMALFGFGADSFIEVGSALLVLWRLRGDEDGCSGARLNRERKAALGIGALFVLLALGTAAGAMFHLIQRHPPGTTLPGVVVSLLSLAFMAWLWVSKRKAASALDSRTLEGDAACSLVCIQLSGVLLAGSLLYLLVPALWWADAVAALVLSAFIAREGISGIRAARRPDFTGGCGCH